MDQQVRLQLFGCDVVQCGEDVHDKCLSCLKEYCVDHLELTAHPCKRLSGNSIRPSESASQVTEVTETQLIVAETPRKNFPYESFSIKAIKKDVTGLFYKESDKIQLLPSGKSWKVKCLACDVLVTRNSSTRYNLVQHLKKHHSLILLHNRRLDINIDGGSSFYGSYCSGDRFTPLVEDDWLKIKEIAKFLKPFKKATLSASGTKITTLSEQLPWYSFLLEVLDNGKKVSSIIN